MTDITVQTIQVVLRISDIRLKQIVSTKTYIAFAIRWVFCNVEAVKTPKVILAIRQKITLGLKENLLVLLI